MLSFCFLGSIIACFFSVQAFRNDSLRESRLFFWIGVACCFASTVAWALVCRQQGKGAEAYGFAFQSVIGTTILGISWGIFFAMCLSEKLGNVLYNLLNSSDQIVKQYDKAVAHEINARYKDALVAYCRYEEEDPLDYVVPERMARCYCHLGQGAQAVCSLQKAEGLLNSRKIKMSPVQKREEIARLLFLQKEIRRKFAFPVDTVLQKVLQNELGDTRFGKAVSDSDGADYFEIWSDCRQS